MDQEIKSSAEVLMCSNVTLLFFFLYRLLAFSSILFVQLPHSDSCLLLMNMWACLHYAVKCVTETELACSMDSLLWLIELELSNHAKSIVLASNQALFYYKMESFQDSVIKTVLVFTFSHLQQYREKGDRNANGRYNLNCTVCFILFCFCYASLCLYVCVKWQERKLQPPLQKLERL